MPHRNLAWLILIAALSLVCYQKVPANRYGRVAARAMDYVSRRYYQPVDDLQLFEGAMKGMTGRLDENSAYISAAKKREFEEDITKEFGGVGMRVGLDPKTKQLVVLAPLPGTPAQQAGIRPGDKILKIDGHGTQGMSLADAVDRMHGKPDTPVSLLVLHPGTPQPVEITIVRRIIPEDTVEGDTRGPDGAWNFLLPGPERIGYVRLSGFAESDRAEPLPGKPAKSTANDLKAALEQLAGQQMRGLVLDLRDNRGGTLKTAVEVCNLFIPSGVIVTTRGRDGQILDSYQAQGRAPYTDFPMAVLINQQSASASEIVAACLQDHHRAVVVGQRSFGKGTVQEVTDLGDRLGALKITHATYWRPSGKNIHHRKDDADGATWGVVPDHGFEVVVDDEEAARFHRWRQDRDLPGTLPPDDSLKHFTDRPLARAIEYLREKEG